MKVTKTNTVHIELEDGDTGRDLYEAVGEIAQGATVSSVPTGYNKVALRFDLPTD